MENIRLGVCRKKRKPGIPSPNCSRHWLSIPLHTVQLVNVLTVEQDSCRVLFPARNNKHAAPTVHTRGSSNRMRHKSTLESRENRRSELSTPLQDLEKAVSKNYPPNS